jgi:hypothetical protein
MSDSYVEIEGYPDDVEAMSQGKLAYKELFQKEMTMKNKQAYFTLEGQMVYTSKNGIFEVYMDDLSGVYTLFADDLSGEPELLRIGTADNLDELISVLRYIKKSNKDAIKSL